MSPSMRVYKTGKIAPVPSASSVTATAFGPPPSRKWVSGWTPSSTSPDPDRREDAGQVRPLVPQLGCVRELAGDRPHDVADRHRRSVGRLPESRLGHVPREDPALYRAPWTAPELAGTPCLTRPFAACPMVPAKKTPGSVVLSHHDDEDGSRERR
jgi:hypothetical protein